MNLLIVRAGQRLTARLWNAFWAERRRRRLVGGPGVLIKDTSDGQIISFRGGGNGFLPQFRVELTGKLIKVGFGLVNEIEPLIEEVPISGDLENPQPALELDDENYDEEGRSWVCVRVEIDPSTGRILQAEGEPPAVTIEQRDKPNSVDAENDLIGFHPLALLRRPTPTTPGAGDLFQIAMFHLKHRAAKQGERWRHFFHPM